MKLLRTIALLGLVAATSVTLASPVAAEPQYGDYAAIVMGNSIPSGRGIAHGTPLVPDAPADSATVTPQNNCDRSWDSGYVQALVGLRMPVDFVACEGDTPPNILNTPRFDELAQVERVGRHHRIAVMTNMGNPQLELTSNCLQAVGRCNLVPDSPDVKRILDTFPASAAIDAQIHTGVKRRAAPDVRVFVVPLPPALPDPDDDLSGCYGLLTPDNIRAMQIILDEANRLMKENAIAAGATFVRLDTEGSPWKERDAAGNGHGVCSPNSWMWGLDVASPQNLGMWLRFEEWFRRILHPKLPGHQAIARVLTPAIREKLPERRSEVNQ